MEKINVGLIPFEKNDFTKNIYPFKINEYLMSGMPVGSINRADLTNFKVLIYESNIANFENNIRATL